MIPRPQTEILVEKCYDILKDIQNPQILEIGTGSGIISIMLALLIPSIKITAVDINEKALELAKKNAIKHKVEEKITLLYSDLFTNIEQNISYNMVISNPPYIASDYKLPKNVQFEPKNALFGGKVGDELLKNIIDTTYKKGIQYLACEIGYDQKKPLQKYIEQHCKYEKLEFYKDLEGFDRGFIAQF